MKRFFLALLLLLPGLLFSGCRDARSYGQIAQAEAKTFHDRFNQQKFSEIYAASTEEFRKSGTEESFTNYLAQVRSRLGRATSIASPTTETRNVEHQIQVILVQRTEFENGPATETFTYVVTNGQAVMMGYFLKSLEPSGK